MIRILDYNDAQDLVKRKVQRMDEAEAVVAPILAAVRERGDEALLEYARKFDELDGVDGSHSGGGLAGSGVSGSGQRRGRQHPRICAAATSAGKDGGVPGWAQARPDGAAARFGGRLYAGGPLSAALHSPDERDSGAGSRREAHLCRLPKPSAEILGIAAWLGVTDFFQMGGAQAIAALAYGTETVPRVDRIVGPGNIYVAAAKKLIAGETGIDFVAGPTEIVIVAAEGNPAWIAADMLAQAEHDLDASAILLTTSRKSG